MGHVYVCAHDLSSLSNVCNLYFWTEREFQVVNTWWSVSIFTNRRKREVKFILNVSDFWRFYPDPSPLCNAAFKVSI